MYQQARLDFAEVERLLFPSFRQKIDSFYTGHSDLSYSIFKHLRVTIQTALNFVYQRRRNFLTTKIYTIA